MRWILGLALYDLVLLIFLTSFLAKEINNQMYGKKFADDSLYYGYKLIAQKFSI